MFCSLLGFFFIVYFIFVVLCCSFWVSMKERLIFGTFCLWNQKKHQIHSISDDVIPDIIMSAGDKILKLIKFKKDSNFVMSLPVHDRKLIASSQQTVLAVFDDITSSSCVMWPSVLFWLVDVQTYDLQFRQVVATALLTDDHLETRQDCYKPAARPSEDKIAVRLCKTTVRPSEDKTAVRPCKTLCGSGTGCSWTAETGIWAVTGGREVRKTWGREAERRGDVSQSIINKQC